MASVTVSEYECEHDLLPALCARCGAPADARVPRQVWIVGEEVHPLPTLAFMFGLFFLPPLAVLVLYRTGRARQIRVPVCATHQGAWGWRDRAMNWLAIPLWSAIVVGVEFCGVVLALRGSDASPYFCVGLPTLLVFLIAENLVIRPGAVRVDYQAKQGVRFAGVHEAFVTALLEDRARDRVDNPDRRALRGGLQADYDDDPV